MATAALSEIPDDVKKQVLADPQVQAAIKQQAQKAGKDAAAALQDPEVQKKILSTVQEKFPQYAAQAKAKIMEWANDPELQASAKKYAALAGQYVAGAGSAIMRQIEQGPAGVKFLCFCGGIASVVNGVMSLLNIFGVIVHPVRYVLSVYQMMFSLTTMLFEMPPDYVAKIPGITTYQDMLMDKAAFLSEALGRGIFYIFQGTLWLCFASLTKPITLSVGLYMCFCGMLNIFVHFNSLITFVEKVNASYTSMPQSSEP
eukprot:TRINITY_DN21154_c0_g2_i1.p1 TRINITY_DN21154_c0_g2~~TRINITY_DN21154_c0_g2_i1.p1  ORF type:complete len:273 (+),score=68.29 TRINITY_DN21154_c0_g2_i1:47-820(+)